MGGIQGMGGIQSMGVYKVWGYTAYGGMGGMGEYTVEHGMHIAQGNWLPDEAKQSSTKREPVAVGGVLMS